MFIPYTFCVAPLSEWKKKDVAKWLKEQQINNELDCFDVERVSAPGHVFAGFSKDDLKESAGVVAGIQLFALKENLLHKERFPEFNVSNYEVHKVFPTGSNKSVFRLDFGESAEIDPPFMIDHSGICGELAEWAKHVTEDQGSHKSICVINGLVKTGKTTVIRYMLPSLVRQYEPKAEFCHLDFDNFMVPHSSQSEIADELLKQLERWARTARFPVPKRTGDRYLDVKSDLHVIMNMFRASGRKIYFLFDEVQRFFQVDSGQADHCLFKALLQLDKWNGGIRFAFTGSGMVRAWTEISKCPANGTTVGASSWIINLPATDPRQALDYATGLLLDYYQVDNTSDIQTLISNMPSIAGRSYLIKLWVRTATKLRTYDQVWEHASLKYGQEFKSDMLPLLDNLHSMGKKRDLVQLRKLAEGNATQHPKSWIEETVYHHFFQYYIEESCNDGPETKYSFASTPFSTLIMQHIGENGNLLTPNVLTLFKYRHNFTGINKLTQTMGEHLSDIIPRKQISGKKYHDPERVAAFHERVEKVTAKHCEKYDFDLDFVMPEVLQWSNTRVRKFLLRKTGSKEWDYSRVDYPYCLFLYALRNCWSHPKGRPDTLTNKLVLDFCPIYWDELVSEFKVIHEEFGDLFLESII